MKTFSDLNFEKGPYSEVANLDFDNHYGVCVTTGHPHDTCEEKPYTLSLTQDGVISPKHFKRYYWGYLTANQVSELMNKIQNYKPYSI